MRFLSDFLKFLWIIMISVMLATGMVALLPSNGTHYGTHHILSLPWLFWMLAIACAFLIFEIVISDLRISEHA